MNKAWNTSKLGGTSGIGEMHRLFDPVIEGRSADMVPNRLYPHWVEAKGYPRRVCFYVCADPETFNVAHLGGGNYALSLDTISIDGKACVEIRWMPIDGLLMQSLQSGQMPQKKPAGSDYFAYLSLRHEQINSMIRDAAEYDKWVLVHVSRDTGKTMMWDEVPVDYATRKKLYDVVKENKSLTKDILTEEEIAKLCWGSHAVPLVYRFLQQLNLNVPDQWLKSEGLMRCSKCGNILRKSPPKPIGITFTADSSRARDYTGEQVRCIKCGEIVRYAGSQQVAHIETETPRDNALKEDLRLSRQASASASENGEEKNESGTPRKGFFRKLFRLG